MTLQADIKSRERTAGPWLKMESPRKLADPRAETAENKAIRQLVMAVSLLLIEGMEVGKLKESSPSVKAGLAALRTVERMRK